MLSETELAHISFLIVVILCDKFNLLVLGHTDRAAIVMINHQPFPILQKK